ncbi:MAG: ElyC/SanA/YdcF family protein [Cyclobacteriaceae bacterium]
MRAFTFLFYLVTILLFAWLLGGYIKNPDTIPTVYNFRSLAGSLLDKFKLLIKYFNDADAWNYMALIAFISVLLLVFSFFNFLAHTLLFKKLNYYLRWFICKGISALLTLFVFIYTTHYIVYQYSTPKIFVDSQDFSEANDIVVLGTRRSLDGGMINAYYRHRIDAVYHLYKQNKVKRIIASGDHSGSYNEPQDIFNDLVRMGVPANLIIKDEAGFRTLDSIVRIKNTYGIRDAIIVSQGFHLQRALFLSWFYNVDAVGYQAGGQMTDKMIRRELLAKPNLFLDVFIFNTQPKRGASDSRRSWQGTSEDFILLGLDLTLLFVALALAYYTFPL